MAGSRQRRRRSNKNHVGGAEASETRVRIWGVALATWLTKFLQGAKRCHSWLKELWLPIYPSMPFRCCRATDQYKQGPGVGIERWLVPPPATWVWICCVTSFVYSEDRNDRAVACARPLFSCRRALWPSIDWVFFPCLVPRHLFTLKVPT